MALKEHTEQHLLAHHRDFAAFAEAMVQTHAGRFDAVWWGFLERYAPAAPARVVDFGTGPGLLLQDLAARYPEAEVVGVDGQPEMLRRAEDLVASVEKAKLVAHDLAAPPIAGIDAGSVDLVVSSMVLHEMPVPTLALDEALRVLRPGGVFVILDWARFPLQAYAEDKRPESLDQFTHYSEHCRYTADDVSWLVAQSGFKVLETMTRKGGKHVLLAAEKPE
jgi:SAM-dependent methyltransferase